jgi:DNA gyrase/topoisomerase IV subunit B
MIARQRSEQCEPAQKEEQVSPALARAERELAFLHNNTFIGTTSLSDFLNTLETSTCPPFVTLSSAIIRAFSELAAKEEKYARSQSKTTVELPAWDNMRKVDTETPDFDFVSLARVKLGTVSLAEFLEEIRKGQQVKDWSVGLPWVVAVFEKLAQKDMEREANGKAKALRRWLVGGLVEEY